MGNGWAHQQLRKNLLPKAYGKPCHHCGKPMLPGQALDLDHTRDRTSYRGMAHASCNRAEGAHITNTRRANPTSRDW